VPDLGSILTAMIPPTSRQSVKIKSRATRSHDDFSNARTPQNRDSDESAAVRCAQLLFEPVAIRVNGFHTYLELRRDFQSCFAIAK
jgi:hypothetical protein